MSRLVIQYTDTRGFAGAEQALLHVLAGLDRQRWRPMLMYHPSPGVQPLLTHARDLGVQLQPTPAMPRGIKGAGRIPRCAVMLRRLRPAIFHAHLTWPLACTYGLAAAVLAGVRGPVATAHLFVELPYDRMARVQQRLIARRLGAYIAVSRHVACRLRAVFGVPEAKLHVIHNGIPAPVLTASGQPDVRASLGARSDQPVVLTCARLDRQKGIQDLVQAAAHVPNVLFAVAGEGPERASLEQQVAGLGLQQRFVFLGQRTDVPALLAGADVFVLPSWYEGLPLSLLEAMSMGRAVIATAIGGTDEVVRDGETGLLVPAHDPPALGAAIRHLLEDASLRARLASAGQARARGEFSVQRMVSQVEDIYAGVLDGRPAG